ncbi:MAG: ion transporter [Emergencia sp.]
MNRINRKRIYTIIQVGNLSDFPSRLYDFILVIAVVINIIIAIFDTFPASQAYKAQIQISETATVIFFTIDYILRIWTADYFYEELTPGRARLRFIFSWAGIVDFLSCIPFFIPAGGAVFRMLRIVRILRVFRIHYYADPLRVIGEVLRKKRGQLLSSIFIVLVLMTAASLMMYNLEHKAQPEVFANAFSGFWWAVNTLLTVGYGDIVPITAGGRLCGTILTFLGVFMVAIPTGILSAGFMEQVTLVGDPEFFGFTSEEEIICDTCDADDSTRSSSGRTLRYCPCCGENLEDLTLSESRYTYCPYCGNPLPLSTR